MKLNKRVGLIIPLVLIIVFSLTEKNEDQFEVRENNAARIMFYNCENYFDYFDDSVKRDDEFTPKGSRSWNARKFYDKRNKIVKIITAVGGWESPAIVGLCEIENFYVLYELAKKSALKKVSYEIVHHESPDRRGIDVALLYRPDKFKFIDDQAIQINFPFAPDSKTRDILYVKGILLNTDTLHVFINHWPSRWGGQFVTEPKRKYVAQVLKSKVDSIIAKNKNANILIMGDLNDKPNNQSLTEVLIAKPPKDSLKEFSLFNLMLDDKMKNKGTHTYLNETNYDLSILDHIIVNKALLCSKGKLAIRNHQAHIFKADFLMERAANGEERTNRTYIGFKYHGGFSDHLPVYIDIEKK